MTSLLTVLAFVALQASGTDPLAEEFANPPAESRPRTWCHWMDNNISREGDPLVPSGLEGPVKLLAR